MNMSSPPENAPHPYYAARRDMIAAEFEQSLTAASDEFARLLPHPSLDELRPLIFTEFDRVLTRLPYVGGSGGRMTPFFEANVGIIAIGRVLRRAGVSFAANSELMRHTYLAKLMKLPEDDRIELGRQWLSPESQRFLRSEAAQSEARENPGDFVYEYVKAGKTEDGESFEFGLNYHECGFCKLCASEGDEDLLPAICAMDKEVYAVRGVELFRSTTIASGGSRCDFRFRQRANVDHGEKSHAAEAISSFRN